MTEIKGEVKYLEIQSGEGNPWVFYFFVQLAVDFFAGVPYNIT
jgi:hypothetical protein